MIWLLPVQYASRYSMYIVKLISTIISTSYNIIINGTWYFITIS
jgi:hypothetical protein